MANIRKSFNFRTGLQVDNDNFVVNENGLVGIGTSVPQNYLLNVHGDTRVTGLVTTGELYAGIGTVGVLSATSADVSGILTVGQLKVGSSEIVDNLIGYARTTFITDNAGVGLHTTSKIGINTTTSPGGGDNEFKVHGDADVTGTLTATTFNGSGASLTNIPNSATTATNTNTASTIVARDASGNFSAGTISATLSGNATTASNLTGSPNITVANVSASNVSSGIVTATTELNVGSGGTALTALSTGRLGIGTALPTSEIQVRKASGSLVEVVSDGGQARISIGNSVGVGKSTGVIRFGSSANDLDIINNDNDGDINFLLNGNGVAGSGKFSWKDGNGFTEVMSVSSNGNFSVLGITTLASAGGITTTGGHLYVNNNLSVGGTISATDITLPSVISSTNLNNNSGITTVAEIHIVGDSRIGIGSTAPIANIDGIGKTAYLGKVAVGYDDATTDIDTYNLAVDGKIVATEGVFAPSFNFTVASGIVTAFGGFVSYGNTAVQIFVEGSTLRFNVVGIGSTTLALI